MPKIGRPGINNRAETSGMLNIQRRHLCNWLNTSAIIIDDHNNSHDGNNDLDDNGNKNDGHDSLRNFFSPAELDGDSSKTDLNVDTEQDKLHK